MSDELRDILERMGGLGIPYRVDWSGLPELGSTLLSESSRFADMLTPKPLAALRAYQGWFAESERERNPLLMVPGMLGMALEWGLPVEQVGMRAGEGLLAKLGPLVYEGMQYGKMLPREMWELAGTYVGKGSKLWKSAPQVGEFAPPARDVVRYSDRTWDQLKPRDLVYRGITSDEAEFIANNGIIRSTGKYSHPSEGTSFAQDWYSAEDAVNVGRTSPDVTGKPTYVLEVKSGPEVSVDPRDYFPKSKEPIPSDRITRAWRFDSRDSPVPVQLIDGKWVEVNPQVNTTYPQGAFSNMYDSAKVGPMMEISDAPMKFKDFLGHVNKTGPFKLSEVVDHPELFKAYPELADEPVRFFEGKGGTAASWTPEGGIEIFRGSGKVGKRDAELMQIDVRRSLIHEIQHAIQEREGWARGGSPEQFKGWDIDRLRADNKTQADRLKYLIRNGQEQGLTPSDVLHTDEGKLISDNLIKLQEAISQYENPERFYNRLFGEYMARDAASRAKLDLMERLRQMPFGSEPEMTPERMIYRYGDVQGPQMMTLGHASRVKFDRFKLGEFDRTGTGGMSEGYGTYLAENPKVVDWYQNYLGARPGGLKDVVLFEGDKVPAADVHDKLIRDLMPYMSSEDASHAAHRFMWHFKEDFFSPEEAAQVVSKGINASPEASNVLDWYAKGLERPWYQDETRFNLIPQKGKRSMSEMSREEQHLWYDMQGSLGWLSPSRLSEEDALTKLRDQLEKTIEVQRSNLSYRNAKGESQGSEESLRWLDEAQKKLDLLERYKGQARLEPKSVYRYKVDVPEGLTWLDWNEELWKQPKDVFDKLKPYLKNMVPENEIDNFFRMGGQHHKLETQQLRMTGEDLYRRIQTELGSDKAASEYLQSLGIHGNKYLDAGSRARGEGSYNYVVFDPELIDILEISKNQTLKDLARTMAA